jgi:hypothetical protein
MAYRSNLNTRLVLLPIDDALLNLAFHRVGPLVRLDLADTDVRTLSATQILLEIFDL